MSNQESCAVLSSFNCDPFVALLNHSSKSNALSALGVDFGQVTSVLIDQDHPVWKESPTYTFIWTLPEQVLPSFRSILEGFPPGIDTLDQEVDLFARQILAAVPRSNATFVTSWALDPAYRALGMQAWKPGIGIRWFLTRINLRLAELFKDEEGVFLLDSEHWLTSVGPGAVNPKLYYMGKIKYNQNLFQVAVSELLAAINGVRGLAKKLVILDLDNTLWGGIVGDDGWENLLLGGHDPKGEAFQHFQKELKALTRQGVILGIVSKNEEDIALEAIDKHPEMILRREDFSGWRINWMDKASNVQQLTAELNLGLQSVVFIDDNPVERDQVATALPEVLVPDWPKDPMHYVSALHNLKVFDQPSITDEDRKRTGSYVSERQRKQVQQSASSIEEWLRNLDIKVEIKAFASANLKRINQLLNKTNQMNLSTRRLTEQEMLAWVEDPSNHLWSVHVSDRFGDYGLTGILSVTVQGDIATIVDFILSCRVFNRRVEHAMLHHAVTFAMQQNQQKIKATFLPTKKNKPCKSFFDDSIMETDGDEYAIVLPIEVKLPADITIIAD